MRERLQLKMKGKKRTEIRDIQSKDEWDLMLNKDGLK